MSVVGSPRIQWPWIQIDIYEVGEESTTTIKTDSSASHKLSSVKSNASCQPVGGKTGLKLCTIYGLVDRAFFVIMSTPCNVGCYRGFHWHRWHDNVVRTALGHRVFTPPTSVLSKTNRNFSWMSSVRRPSPCWHEYSVSSWMSISQKSTSQA